MIDIHTHILPYMDDGAKDTNMALAILKILETDNVSDVVLTPHFYSDAENLEQFVKRRNEKYKEFKKYYEGNISLHLGAEVYLSEYLLNYNDLTELCIDKTNYMLIECPFDNYLSSTIYEIIESLIYNHQITPIIAHIERYPFIYLTKDLSLIESLKSIGCLIQINADSLLSKKVKKFVLSIISNELVDVIGSDTHNLINRPPNYSQAIEIINSKLGVEYVNKITSFNPITDK